VIGGPGASGPMSVMRMSMGQKASAKDICKRAFSAGGSAKVSDAAASEEPAEEAADDNHLGMLERRIHTLQIPEAELEESAYERRFNIAMGILIVLNIFVIAIETDAYDDSGNMEDKIAWIIVDSLFIFVFIVEIGVRVHWERQRWVRSAWNWFDVVIVLIAMMDIWILSLMQEDVGSLHVLSIFRIVRLVRLVRLVKLVRLLHGFYVILAAFWHAMQTMSFLLAIMLFGLLIYSIFATNLIGRNESLKDVRINGDTIDDRFGTVYRSMYSLFELMTLEGWETVARPIVEKQPFMFIFIASFIMIFTFGMLNMIVALVIEKTLHHTRMMGEHSLSMQRQKMAEELLRVRSLFSHDSGTGHSGKITCEQFERALKESESVSKIFAEMGVAPNDARELFVVLDWDGSGDLTVKEFLEGLEKLQNGTPSPWDSLATHAIVRNIKSNVLDLQEKVSGMIADQAKWRGRLEARLQEQSEQMTSLMSYLNRTNSGKRDIVDSGARVSAGENAPELAPSDAADSE